MSRSLLSQDLEGGALLNRDAIEAVRKRTALEMRDKQRALAVDVDHVIATAVGRGMLRSGFTQGQLGGLIRREYEDRALAILSTLESIAGKSSLAGDKELRHQLLKLASELLDENCGDLKTVHQRAVSLMKSAPGLAALSEYRAEAIEKVSSELELAVLVPPQETAEGQSRPGTPLSRVSKHPVWIVFGLLVALTTGLVAVQSSLATIYGWLSPVVPYFSVLNDELAVSELVPGRQVSRYVDALGDYQYRRTIEGWAEYVFVRPNCYIQALADQDERVLMYAVTARNPDFHPSFEWPDDGSETPPVVLGTTTFAEWAQSPHLGGAASPDWIRGHFGASWMHYMECVKLSHVDNFISIVVASSDAGQFYDTAETMPFPQDEYPEPLNAAIRRNDPADPAIAWYRRGTPINTYGEASPDFDPSVLYQADGFPAFDVVVGPDPVQVGAGTD